MDSAVQPMDVGSPGNERPPIDRAAIRRPIHVDGILGCRGAFSRGWVAELAVDIEAAVAEALARPSGAVGRRPYRHHVELTSLAFTTTAVDIDYWAALPAEFRQHLACPVVPVLTPMTQKHTIEGLVMGGA